MIKAKTASNRLKANVNTFNAGRQTRSTMRKLDKLVKTAIAKRQNSVVIASNDTKIVMTSEVIERLQSDGYQVSVANLQEGANIFLTF
jgi:sucrose-6-phosphate hydrolase SacC (GH32 family)